MGTLGEVLLGQKMCCAGVLPVATVHSFGRYGKGARGLCRPNSNDHL